MAVAASKQHLVWRGIRESLRFGLPLAWGANRTLCLWLLISTAASAIAGPLLVVVLGASVGEIQTALASGTSDAGALTRWIAIAAGLSLLVATTEEVRRYVRRRLEDEVQLRVDSRLIWHVAGLDVATLEDAATQDALNRASIHPGRSVLALLLGIVESASSGFQAVAYLGLLLWIEPVWSLLLVGAALPHVASRWSLSRSNHETIRSRTTARRWGAYYSEILRDHRFVPELKVMRLAPLLARRFEASVTTVLKASRRIYRMQAVAHLLSTAVSIAAVLVIVTMVGRGAMSGAITLGSFVAYWTAAWRMRSVIARLSDAVSTFFDGHFELVNIRDVLNLQAKIPAGGRVRKRVQGRIELCHLTFRYPGAAEPTIDNLSAVIEPGECVALVGPNGAGKTTLAKLIARLYEPSDGAVMIDGVDSRDWDLAELHRQMSVVFQETARIEATLGENIAFGDWERLLDRPELVPTAAGRTGFHHVAEELPDGYRTHIGRRFGNVDLSGGQWRQLAVTRGLANDPALIILDEPTANLDVYAEERFYRSIRELLRGRTSVLISHRFTTLRQADRLLVLNAGRLVEQGSHEELLANNGLYASMFQSFTARLARPGGQRDAA
jgi:ATP-binding cassette subfamily B protein